MPTLTTPAQYEAALEELNALRPLYLQARPRISLDIALLNKLPKESVKSIAGTLAKCTPDGALLVKNNHDLTSYEKISKSCTITQCLYEITFTQKVYKVLVSITSMSAGSGLLWNEPTYSTPLYVMTSVGNYCLPFIGITMYMRSANAPLGGTVFDLYGFY